MGKITQEQRNRYFEKVKEHRSVIEAGLAKEKTLIELLSKDATGAGYKRLRLAEEVLDLSSWYILVNTLSVSLLGIKNEDYLLEGRKTLVRALKYLDDTVGAPMDAAFSEYEAKLDEIKDLDYPSRLRLARKFAFAIQSLEEAFGDNSKYSLSFVDLWGKLGSLAKNLVDLRTVVSDLGFDSPCRDSVSALLAMAKGTFQRCADKYREKYELYSNKAEDFRIAIRYLAALRRLAVALGDREEAETLKKKTDVWNAKLEADAKKTETAKKRP